MAKKSKSGNKFMLGAVLGGLVGLVAGKFFKTNEKEIKEGVDKKIGELKNKFNSVKDDLKDNLENAIDDAEEDAEDEAEDAAEEAKEKASKVTKK